MNPRNADPKHVLLIRLSSLGDVVLATSALEPFRRAGWRISWVVKRAFAPVLARQPGVDAIFPFGSDAGEAAAERELLAWAAERRFSHLLDLQNSWRTWRWRRQLEIPEQWVLGKDRLREWRILFLRQSESAGFGPGGRARRFQQVAEKMTGMELPEAWPATHLELSAEERQAAEELVPRTEFAVLLPGGAWASKAWPYFPELARALASKVPVVALGAAKDEICGSVARAGGAQPESRSLHGKCGLRQSMAVLAHPRARWVIGNDTGMIHVAEALGKDVAVIEGPTAPAMGFSPYRENSLRLGLRLSCRPCSKSGRICWRWGSRRCLRGLLPGQLIAELRSRGYPC